MEKLSVIMCVCNESEDYVKLALDSILEQSYKTFEFIIVVDNPRNEVLIHLVRRYAQFDKRLRVLINSNNIGLALSLNRGMEVARGEFVARMDADDIAKPNRLERELDAIKKNSLDMIFTLVDKIDEEGEVWDRISPFPTSAEFITEMLPVQNIVVHPTVMFRTECVRALKGYRPYASCQDYDLWLRMLTNRFRIGVLNEYLLYYRVHINSISSSKHFLQILNEDHIRKMYIERKKSGMDSFSDRNLMDYLRKKGAFDEQKVTCENEYFH